jgi:hypothetical protein
MSLTIDDLSQSSCYRLGQDPAEILPNQLVQGLRRGQACRAALPLSRPQGVGPTAANVIVVPRGQGTP